MKYYLIYTEDKADSLDIRLANRGAHLAWVQADPHVDLLSAGPWLDDDGEMRGSLMIVKAETLKIVEDWLAQDPYNNAGLTGFKRVREFNWLLGAPS